jgi:hypothetical protein
MAMAKNTIVRSTPQDFCPMATASFCVFPLAKADESVEAIMVTDERGLVKQKMNAALRRLSVNVK